MTLLRRTDRGLYCEAGDFHVDPWAAVDRAVVTHAHGDHPVDAVLMYAQPGSGRRGGLYTEYTLGIWDGDTLVPFAKAYSGLSDEEIRRVDAFVRRNTVAKFGPVRTVRPELVFEVAFEGIQRSTRHKSGLAVRSPRMARWRTDKRPEDADTVETVRALMAEEEGARGG